MRRKASWAKVHYKLFKLGALLCVLYGIITLVYYSFFYKEDRYLGKYYVYTVFEDSLHKTVLFWRGRDCELAIMHGGFNAKQLAEIPYSTWGMDTTSVDIFEAVQLINFECDSTVGVIRFKNRNHNPNIRTSKSINPEFHEALVDLKNLHARLPN